MAMASCLLPCGPQLAPTPFSQTVRLPLESNSACLRLSVVPRDIWLRPLLGRPKIRRIGVRQTVTAMSQRTVKEESPQEATEEVPLVERHSEEAGSPGPLDEAQGNPSPSQEPSGWMAMATSRTALVAGGAALLLLIGAGVVLGSPGEWLQWVEARVKDAAEAAEAAGPLAPFYFGLLYVGCTVLLLPASVLTIGAGYIFGALKGTAVVSVASTTGAALAFLIARYAARPLVARQLAKYSKFATVDRAISQEGGKIVFLWRLSPLFPFAASNYMFGLTGVGFWPYVGASWVAMLPATFTYVYLGSVGRATVDAISGDAQAQVQPFKIVLYVVGAIATLLVTREVSSRASQALKEAEENEM